MTLSLQGIGVSNGVAIGPVHIAPSGNIEILEYALIPELVNDEITRFERALTSVKQHLEQVRNQIPLETQSDITAFIDTHLLMLDDSTLSKTPIKLIQEKQCNAEWALELQKRALVEVFDAMDDPYLRTRRDDIEHVVTSVQRVLLSSPIYHYVDHAQEQRFSGHIIVAEELTPADIILMQHQGIAGFITEGGGPTSHTAILARSLNIPGIVGLHQARHLLQNTELVIIDSQRGIMLTDVDVNLVQHFQTKKRDISHRIEQHKATKHTPATTQDGIRITLHANIELSEEITAMHDVGAEGVGLFRTEYLFMNRDTPPDEEEQFNAYLSIVKQLDGKPLTIRTLDIGADKQINMGNDHSLVANNPALGLRAIRVYLQDPTIFLPQLRAILRVSAFGPVKLMIPMISTVQEILQIRSHIQTLCQQFMNEEIPFDAAIPIGGMIEVPAAALNASMLCEHLDFISIGTNDLIQYTLAIDRTNDEVNYLYDPFNPAVLQLITTTIRAAQHANIPVMMCGEMAGDPSFTGFLLGAGLTNFSMHPNALPDVKHTILQSDVSALQPLVQQLVNSTSWQTFHHALDKLTHL